MQVEQTLLEKLNVWQLEGIGKHELLDNYYDEVHKEQLKAF